MDTSLPKVLDIGNGEKITFARVVIKDGKEILEGENIVQPHAGPPMHVHYKQDEIITVVSGNMAYQEPGEAPKYAGPGETVVFKAGVPHKFWNPGPGVLHCDGHISPPDNVVFFLSSIYQSMAENGGHRPGMYDAAFLLTRYKNEFGMLEIPVFVQKYVFPIILFVGNLMGKNKKFADAPPPMG